MNKNPINPTRQIYPQSKVDAYKRLLEGHLEYMARKGVSLADYFNEWNMGWKSQGN